MKNSPFIKIISFAFKSVIILIIMNIVYLGVSGIHFISETDIKEYADNRGVKEEVLYAKRGNIFSSDGETIATDVTNYKLIAILDKNQFSASVNGQKVPAHVTDYEATANAVAPILKMPVEDMLKILNQENLFQVEFGLYGNITSVQRERIIALGLPGFRFIETTKRYYPFGELLAYEVGYSKFQGDTQVGEMGIEYAFNDVLTGKNGMVVSQTDSKGFTLPNAVMNQTNPQIGSDIYLTIDSSLQRELEIELDRLMDVTKAIENWGIILDMKTGKVLAMSNKPGFDANILEIDKYVDNILASPYEPGSTMKPFLYATAITEGVYKGSATYDSSQFEIKNNDGTVANVVKDWNKTGWGTMTYDRGLIYSSNTAMCSLLDKYLNYNKYYEKLEQLGFFSKQTFDNLQTEAGHLDKTGTNYYFVGFGQGATVTPMQLVQAFTVFANDGKMVSPYLVDYIKNPTTDEVTYSATTQYSEQIFSEEAIRHVSDLMEQVVEDPFGTGTAYQMDDIKIFGKSGTAEYSVDGTGYVEGKSVYSFVGMSTYDNPRYLVYLASRQSSDVHPSAELGKSFKMLMRSTMNKFDNKIDSNTQNGVVEYNLNSFINHSIDFAKSSLQTNDSPFYIIGTGDTVTNQSPAAYSTITNKDKVFILTNSNEISILDFSNWSRKDVSRYCQLIGIDVEFTGVGYVDSQSIEAGTKVYAGDVLKIGLK